MKNFIEWLKNLLKRFKFDNTLFKKGIDEVMKLIKKEVQKLKELNKYKEVLRKALYTVFGKIKPLRKIIDEVIEKLDAEWGADLDLIKPINKKLDYLAEKLIKYYNDNF